MVKYLVNCNCACAVRVSQIFRWKGWSSIFFELGSKKIGKDVANIDLYQAMSNENLKQNMILVLSKVQHQASTIEAQDTGKRVSNAWSSLHFGDSKLIIDH